MKQINKLKYAGIVATVGLAAVIFGSGAYAGSENGNESAENEVITIDLTPADQRETVEETNEFDMAAGIGEVLDNIDAGDTSDESDNVDEAAELMVLAEEEANEPETYWGYTNLGIAHVDNHLNIREEPNENGKLVGKLPKDAACEILDIDENGWAHIKSGKVEGYCSTDYLYMGEEAIARGKEVASMIAVVNTETLKVRGEPNTDSIVITLIPIEEELEVVDIMENGWIKFMLDDEEAYVSGDYVDVEERLEKAVTLTELQYGQGVSDVRVSLVQYAKQFVGNPYVWGGTSLTNGADCSGFTLSIYKKYGVSLPHHAASQAQLGTKVDISNLQPGDLVFYAKNGSINHVAIYIGNGQVVHASNPKTGIKISNLYYRTPYCARRFL
jgi:uncharacterized protein YgiM (DUF1202 family)